MYLMNRKLKDVSVRQLKVIAFYEAIMLLPLTFKLSYFRLLNALLDEKIK
jgi:hypothetical protein